MGPIQAFFKNPITGLVVALVVIMFIEFSGLVFLALRRGQTPEAKTPPAPKKKAAFAGHSARRA